MSARDKIFGGILAIISALILFTGLILLWHPLYNSLWYVVVKVMTSIVVIGVFGILTWIGVAIVRTPSVEEIEAKSNK